MKRILAVLMSTAMVLSLAACSQETAKTPEEIYDEALVKSMSLDALDGDMEIAMDMDMGGMTLICRSRRSRTLSRRWLW